jgi:hypothetical protein
MEQGPVETSTTFVPTCPKSFCKKRVLAELKRWSEVDILPFVYDSATNTASFPFCTIDLPLSYPFYPPSVRWGERRRLIGRLDPLTWSLCVMSNPQFLKTIPSWDVKCFCCSSAVCAWSPSMRIASVAREVLFTIHYSEMKSIVESIRFFSLLPLDVIECLASICG